MPPRSPPAKRLGGLPIGSHGEVLADREKPPIEQIGPRSGAICGEDNSSPRTHLGYGAPDANLSFGGCALWPRMMGVDDTFVLFPICSGTHPDTARRMVLPEQYWTVFPGFAAQYLLGGGEQIEGSLMFNHQPYRQRKTPL